MYIRRVSQVGCVAGAVLLLIMCPNTSVRAQFAPVNKARSLEKSVMEGDEEVRKIKTDQAEIKSAKPASVKSKSAKPKIIREMDARKATLDKVIPAKAQKPAKPAPAKATSVKPMAPKSVPTKSVQTPPRTVTVAAKPTPKKRRVRMRYVKPTPMVVVEGMDRQSLISTISEDGRFVYLRVTPETVFRMGGQIVPATAIVDGMKLDCWGGWAKTAPDVYTAKGVVVKGKLDDFAMRLKINEACQKLSRVRPSVAAGPVQPTVITEAAPPAEKKPEEKKPEEVKPAEPKPEEPKPADPNAPPANPEVPNPADPQPAQPGNP